MVKGNNMSDFAFEKQQREIFKERFKKIKPRLKKGVLLEGRTVIGNELLGRWFVTDVLGKYMRVIEIVDGDLHSELECKNESFVHIKWFCWNYGIRIVKPFVDNDRIGIQKVKLGDVFYSEYFNSWCQVTGLLEDGYFMFKRNRNDRPMKSRIKQSYLLENNLIFRNEILWKK